MIETDILNPNDMKAQCMAAIQGLQEDNTTLTTVTNSLNSFIDSDLKSSSFDNLKQQLSDYHTIISTMAMANSYDIIDYTTLQNAVGDEILIGSTIIPAKDKNWENKVDAEELAEEYLALAAKYVSEPFITSYYNWCASTQQLLADHYYNRYLYWKEKEDAFDAIEANTSSLPGAGKAIRNIAIQAIYSVVDSFQNGSYVPDREASWRGQIQEVTETALKKNMPAVLGNLSNKSMAEMSAGELKVYTTLIDMLVHGELTEHEMTMVVDAYYMTKVAMGSRHPKKGAAELSYSIDAYLKGASAIGLVTNEDIQRGTVVIAALSVGEIYEVGEIVYDKKAKIYTFDYTSGYYRDSIVSAYTAGKVENIKVEEVKRGELTGTKADRDGDKLLGKLLQFDLGDEIGGIAQDAIIDKITETVVEKGLEWGGTVTFGITTVIGAGMNYAENRGTASKAKKIAEIDNGGLAMKELDLIYASAIRSDGMYYSSIYTSENTAEELKEWNKRLTEQGKEELTYEDIYYASGDITDIMYEILAEDR